ncbi:glycoside hydrolase family 3 C-terminal domain-containing protein [Salinarchaeum chitinilyticum]
MSTADTEVPELLQELTLEEKSQLVHGAVDPTGTATGYLPGIERLDIPEFRLADGPMGVRAGDAESTAFPASIALSATFDPELAREQGVAMGREATARNQDAVLGPGVNLIRVPHCGRNFEYYSEDPVLTAAFAREIVGGLESEDVVATPKHFVANNQESSRASVNVDVSERALRECYLPGFKAAVDAGAGSMMTAYNSVNGEFMSDNRPLVTDVLKEEWGFDGYVVSDWFGATSTVGAANGGLDLEMPGISLEEMREMFGMETGDDDEDQVLAESEEMGDGMPDPTNTGQFADPLVDAVRSGEVPESRLDDMVRRILRQMERSGEFGDTSDDSRSEESTHQTLAKTVAARGAVLLKNHDALPLEDDTDVAIIGPAAQEARIGGGGSSEVEPPHEIPTADGIRDRTTGEATVADGIEQVEQVSFFGDGESETTESQPEPSLDEALDAAETAEVAVVVVEDAATEGADRDTLQLPGRQDELVREVASVSDDTVVVVQSSGPVELPWRDDVAAIVETWYPGQSDGDAVAAVLFGDVDASGRLPVSFAQEEAYPTSGSAATFPGEDGEVHYEEDLFVGYKHFDVADDDPIYSFGHGLSYADYTYESVAVVDERTVEITVENTSQRDGREVVQAYVRPPGTDDDRPVREFAGFDSVRVPAGETVTTTVDLADLAFSRYDDSEGWVDVDGQFELEVGRSAQDIRLTTSL